MWTLLLQEQEVLKLHDFKGCKIESVSNEVQAEMQIILELSFYNLKILCIAM